MKTHVIFISKADEGGADSKIRRSGKFESVFLKNLNAQERRKHVCLLLNPEEVNSLMSEVEEQISRNVPVRIFQEDRMGDGATLLATLVNGSSYGVQMAQWNYDRTQVEIIGETCETCNGEGEVLVGVLLPTGHVEEEDTCPDCNGNGVVSTFISPSVLAANQCIPEAELRAMFCERPINQPFFILQLTSFRY